MATDEFGYNIIDKEDIKIDDKNIYNDKSVLDNLHQKVNYLNKDSETPQKTELHKLVEYLDGHDIPYVWDRRDNNQTIEIHALLNRTNHGSYFYGTVSLDNGMLSVTGDLANGVKDSGLTAQEVIDRLGEQKLVQENPEYLPKQEVKQKEKQFGVVEQKLHAYAKQQTMVPQQPVNKKSQNISR